MFARPKLHRPKGPQYPNAFRFGSRTNWKDAGQPSAFARFWPSDQEPGTVIKMYGAKDDDVKIYRMAKGGGQIIKPGGWVRESLSAYEQAEGNSEP